MKEKILTLAIDYEKTVDLIIKNQFNRSMDQIMQMLKKRVLNCLMGKYWKLITISDIHVLKFYSSLL